MSDGGWYGWCVRIRVLPGVADALRLRATAHTRDGIVEAIELNEAEAQTGPFLLGMQFHPERLWERYPEFLKPFRAFIKACRP